jgi:pyruvate/2-oxoacid:ferredoxin oxidoreductase beta subunit
VYVEGAKLSMGDLHFSQGDGEITFCGAIEMAGYIDLGVELIKGGIQHKGFALIDVFSPCVTFNLDNDHPFFKQRVKKLEDDGHDTSDWKAACEKAMVWGDTIYTGLFFQNKERESLLENREAVLLSKRLVTIIRDLPVQLDLDALAVGEPEEERMIPP